VCHRVWSRGMGPMDKRSLDPETERVRRIWEKGLNSYFPIFTCPLWRLSARRSNHRRPFLSSAHL